MDGENFDPLLHLSLGTLIVFATIVVAVGILAAVGAAAGVPPSEMLSH